MFPAHQMTAPCAHSDASAPPALLPADGTKAGVAAEGANAARAAGSKQLTLQEAEMILGIESGATWQEIMKVGQPRQAGTPRRKPGRRQPAGRQRAPHPAASGSCQARAGTAPPPASAARRSTTICSRPTRRAAPSTCSPRSTGGRAAAAGVAPCSRCCAARLGAP